MSPLEQKMMEYMSNSPAYQPLIKPINRLLAAANDDDPATGPEGEIKKYFTFDETGHIMISSTVEQEKDMDPGVREVFQKAIVFFGAWTAAIASKQKTLYDYDAVSGIIGASGYFVNMATEDRTFNYTSHEMSIGNSIIADALGSIASGGSAMKIAQNIVQGLGGQLRISSEHEDKHQKIAQLMFVCQNLMGMPIVNVSLYYIQRDETVDVSKTDCSSSTTDTINFKYHKQDFMFVDPTLLEKYSKDFSQSKEYQDLIKKLADLIPTDKPTS